MVWPLVHIELTSKESAAFLLAVRTGGQQFMILPLSEDRSVFPFYDLSVED